MLLFSRGTILVKYEIGDTSERNRKISAQTSKKAGNNTNHKQQQSPAGFAGAPRMKR